VIKKNYWVKIMNVKLFLSYCDRVDAFLKEEKQREKMANMLFATAGAIGFKFKGLK